MTVASLDRPQMATSADVPKPTFAAMYSLFLIALVGLSANIDRFIVAALTEPIRHTMGITDIQMGLLQGVAFVILFAVAGVPIVRLADRGNRKIILSCALVVWSGATLWTAAAQSFESFFIGRMLVGLGEAGFVSCCLSMIADLFHPVYRGRATGVFTSTIPLGKGAAFILGAGFFSYFALSYSQDASWRLTFVVFGAFGLVLAALMLFTIREPERDPSRRVTRRSPAELWRVMAQHGGMIFFTMIAGGAISLAIIPYTGWLPTYLVRHFGQSIAAASTVVSLILMILGGGAALFGGWLTDWGAKRFGPKWYATQAIIFAALGAIPMAAAPHMETVTTLLVVFGFGYSCLAVALATPSTILQIKLPGDTRAQMSYVYSLYGYVVAFGLGSVAVPWLTQHVTSAMGVSLSVLTGCSSVLAVLVFAFFVYPQLSKELT